LVEVFIGIQCDRKGGWGVVGGGTEMLGWEKI